VLADPAVLVNGILATYPLKRTLVRPISNELLCLAQPVLSDQAHSPDGRHICPCLSGYFLLKRSFDKHIYGLSGKRTSSKLGMKLPLPSFPLLKPVLRDAQMSLPGPCHRFFLAVVQDVESIIASPFRPGR
jgi:hypothetical protein